jgi:hypothetical protein
MLSKTRQKWKVFLPNCTHIISVQKFGNLGFDDFEPLKFSSVQIFKNVYCILISKDLPNFLVRTVSFMRNFHFLKRLLLSQYLAGVVMTGFL